MSCDLIMNDISSSSSAQDLNIDNMQPGTEEPPVKFKVPSCQQLEKEHLVQMLTPYKQYIDQFLALVLWRRPIQLILCLIYINTVSFLIYFLHFSFINVLIIFISTITFISLVYVNHNAFTKFFFPPVLTYGEATETNRIFTLEEIAEVISVVGSRIHCFLQSCAIRATDKNIFGQLAWIAILCCMFVFFKVAKTFWIFYGIINAIFIVPGFIFHPAINPSIKDYLKWVMMVIAPKIKED